jgi:hypothetical protein
VVLSGCASGESAATALADNAAFDADVTISRSALDRTDGCDCAHRIGDAAVTTLKGGA